MVDFTRALSFLSPFRPHASSSEDNVSSEAESKVTNVSSGNASVEPALYSQDSTELVEPSTTQACIDDGIANDRPKADKPKAVVKASKPNDISERRFEQQMAALGYPYWNNLRGSERAEKKKQAIAMLQKDLGVKVTGEMNNVTRVRMRVESARLQQTLAKLGFDSELGRTGPQKNGVDGDFRSKSRSVWDQAKMAGLIQGERPLASTSAAQSN